MMRRSGPKAPPALHTHHTRSWTQVDEPQRHVRTVFQLTERRHTSRDWFAPRAVITRPRDASVNVIGL